MALDTEMKSGREHLADENQQENSAIKIDNQDAYEKASGSMSLIYANETTKRAFKIARVDGKTKEDIAKNQTAIDRERIRYSLISEKISDSSHFLMYYKEEGNFTRSGKPAQALALELLEGEPLKLERLSPRLFVFVLGELFSAICQYAKIGIIHRDLYEHNILVDSGLNRIVIIDFGMSWLGDDRGNRSHPEPTASSYMMTKSRCPEMDRDNIKRDVYCVGLMVYNFLQSKDLFDGQAHRDTVRQSEGNTVSSKHGRDDSSNEMTPLHCSENSSAKTSSDVNFLKSLGEKCWRDTGPRKPKGPPTVSQDAYDAISRISPTEALQLIIDHLYGAHVGEPSNANAQSALSLDEESLADKKEHNAQHFPPGTIGPHDDQLETGASEEADSSSLVSERPAIDSDAKAPGVFLGRHVSSRHFINAGAAFICLILFSAFALAFLYRREAITATDNVDAIAAIWLEDIANDGVPSTDKLLESSPRLRTILEGVNDRSKFKSFFNGLQKLSAIKADKGKMSEVADYTGNLYARALGVDSEASLRVSLSTIDIEKNWRKLAFNMHPDSFSSTDASLVYKYVLYICGDIYGNYGDFILDNESNHILANQAYLASRKFRLELNNVAPNGAWKLVAAFKLAQCDHNDYKIKIESESYEPRLEPAENVVVQYERSLNEFEFANLEKYSTELVKASLEGLKAEIAYNRGWSVFRPFSPSGVIWIEDKDKNRLADINRRLEEFGKLVDYRDLVEEGDIDLHWKAKYTSGLYLVAIDLIKSNQELIKLAEEFVIPLRDNADSNKYLDDEEFIKAFVGLPVLETKDGSSPDPRFDKFMLRLLIKAGMIAGKDRQTFFDKIHKLSTIKVDDLEKLSHEVWPKPID